MQLTNNFSLEEFSFSETATRKGIDNTPHEDIMDNLTLTAMGMERVRTRLGSYPIHINSAYRSPKLNAAIGGSKTSKHMVGLAVDFTCPSAGSPMDICKILQRSKEEIGFDQLIHEGTWVHISFPEWPGEPKLEVLTAVFAGGGVTYIKGLV
jgi:zinc D-Ala-D-Ala carboxypeptidase